MAYSTTNDLLTGEVPLPAYLDPQKFVDDAADEIDSMIGFVYETPVDITEDPGNPVARPVRLLLKRISNFLASGRLLMAVETGSEVERIHQYGLYLVTQATAALVEIKEGKVVLEGVPADTDESDAITAPLQYNKDTESNVDAFYDRVVDPSYQFYTFPRNTNPESIN